MEKEMLAIAKFKSGEGKFEKFMGWMQSDEGMGVKSLPFAMTLYIVMIVSLTKLEN